MNPLTASVPQVCQGRKGRDAGPDAVRHARRAFRPHAARIAGGAVLLAVGAPALAHTGHGVERVHGFMAGLSHPFGADHLLAMLAVGLWSAVCFRGALRLAGPGVFLSALVAGAALGMAGLGIGALELLIAASVVTLGVLLIGTHRVSAAAGLLLTAAAALLHGLAHGAELPAGASALAYGAGFVATTAALHLMGLAAGSVLARRAPAAMAWLGGAIGMAGLFMLRAAA